MAHFLKPPGASNAGYDVDGKLAPGSVWRMQIPVGQAREIAVWRGAGLWVKSNNPTVVPNDGFRKQDQGDLKILTLTGGSLGTSLLDVGDGPNVWITLQVQVVAAPAAATSASQLIWNGVRLQALPSDAINAFAAGLVLGFGRQAALDKSWAPKLQTTITGDPLGFQLGYSTGVLTGLVEGLKNLLSTIVDVAKLGASLAPLAAVATNPVLALGWIGSQGFLLLTDQAERELRMKQIEEAEAIAGTIAFALSDIVKHPDAYVDSSREIGEHLGANAGEWFTHEFANLPAKQLGQAIGAIVGLIAFEVLVEVLIAMTTGGAGNATKAGLAAAQGARGASRFSRLLGAIRPILARNRGLARILAKAEDLFAKLRGSRRLAGGAAEAVEAARKAVAEIRAAGKPIMVNIGGEGEVAGAINLNIQRRLNTPVAHFVESDAARIGELFEANSLDGIVSNALPPNTLNWDRVLPGAQKTMKPGSKIVLRFQGAGEDRAAMIARLEKYGFREINAWEKRFPGIKTDGTVFEAIK